MHSKPKTTSTIKLFLQRAFTMPRVLAVAVDGSDFAMAALKEALDFLKEGDDLYLFAVAEEVSISTLGGAGFGGSVYEVVHKMNKERADQIKNVFGPYVEVCRERNVTPICVSGVGSAGQVICQKVDEYKVQDLFLGRRGLGALNRLFLGSVSNYCVNHASCTVVVVKSK